ncbi:MAG: sulfatase [Acetivibrionales bacterium]|jgi:arylsulfatase
MSENKKLNFVWFCTDQQRFDTISSLGNKSIRTPNLDRLVREGIAFTRAYTQSPVCTPSRASFLTGRYPRSTKVCYNGNDIFPKDEVLVTKILADNGYTCGLTGKLHLTSAKGRMEKRTDDGYSFIRWSHHPHDDWEDGINHYQEWLKSKGVKWKDIYRGKYLSMSEWPPVMTPGFSGKEVGPPAELHQTTWCVEEAINFIDECGDKPWLVSINPFDPHPPLDPPQEYKDKLNISDMPLPLWKEGELDNKPPFQKHDYIVGGQNGATDSILDLTDEDKRELRRDYYAEIMLIDDMLGKLIDHLEETGQRENTVIIFMSDHGEMNGDHGLYWKGAYFYEQLVHIPLIISCPSLILQGVQSNALVELVDIAPTILELAGYSIPVGMQGKSLVPILTGKANPDVHKDAVYCEFYSALTNCHDTTYATMYFDGRYKIIVYHGEDYGELYDLKNDPNEFDNLWYNKDYYELKYQLIKKNFDNCILCNRDMSLHKLYTY